MLVYIIYIFSISIVILLNVACEIFLSSRKSKCKW